MKRFSSFSQSLAAAALWIMGSCMSHTGADSDTRALDSLRTYTAALTRAETRDDLRTFLSFYDSAAISQPEFQRPILGIANIGEFYREIFKRQNVKTFTRSHAEFIRLDSTIIELGTFEKSYTGPTADSILTQHGKYCFVWQRYGKSFKLKGETYGFFHPIGHPEELVVKGIPPSGKSEKPFDPHTIPFELRAYNALMEKYVREGAGALRSEFFTQDGKVFPFAHAPVAGVSEIRPYLIKYDTHGPGFKMDSISVWTYHYEYHGRYVLEYPKFFVRWSAPGARGSASGQGIRLWVRQPDHSLRLYREIGTHNLE